MNYVRRSSYAYPLKNVRKPFYDLYLFDDPAAATFASISAILDPMPLNSCDWE